MDSHWPLTFGQADGVTVFLSNVGRFIDENFEGLLSCEHIHIQRHHTAEHIYKKIHRIMAGVSNLLEITAFTETLAKNFSTSYKRLSIKSVCHASSTQAV